jgi:hypothetical protein
MMADVPKDAAATAAAAEQQRQLLQTALRSPIPRLYANGFMIAQSASDMSLILLLNGSPVSVLSLSYITAKSLATDLSASLKAFEVAIGQEIKTVNEIVPKMPNVSDHAHVQF